MARENVWFDTVLNDTSLAASAQEQVQLLPPNFDQFEQYKGMTLIRVLGKITITPVTPSGALGTQLVSAGIGIIGVEALTAGGAAVPSPEVADERPSTGWMWREQIVSQDAAGDPASMTWPQFDFDIRTGRKLMYGIPTWVISNFDVVGTSFAVRYVGIVRALFKRP